MTTIRTVAMASDPTPSPQPERVSSPVATGQGGAFFEQHVDAAFLALLLVRGIPPIFTDTQIAEVTFQTERLGRRTDDVLVRCETGADRTRRINGQVKRTFNVSASDDDCVKTFRDFWEDFRNPSRFTPDDDAFAIITRFGTTVLLLHFGALLDCARVATSAADFSHRLATPGFLNKKAIDYCTETRTILDEANGSPISDEDLWQFLRHVNILSFDLNSSTRQTESLLRTMLAQTAMVADAVGAAEATWLRLLEIVGRDGMPQSGTYKWQDLPDDLRARHGAIPTAHHAALQTLRDRTRTLRRGIRHTVGMGAARFHISRDELAGKVRDALRATRAVIITGPAGVGKSAVASEGFEQLQTNHFAFAFRAEEFATAHLDITLQQASLPITAEQLAGILAGQGAKVLFIESVERLLEKDTRDAFTDLLGLVRDDPSWQLILTCRDYSLDTVRSSFLDHVQIPYSLIGVPVLSDPELDQAIEALPVLRRPASNPPLRQLFRNPYVLDKAATMSWPTDAVLPSDERAFRQKFLREIVRAEDDAGGGMPQRRSETFTEVALRRARVLDAYAPTVGLDAAALESLYQRDLIVYPEDTQALAAPAHDVLEDWAILQWIDDRSRTHGTTFSAFIEELGPHPAIRRSYRKWLGELLVCDAARADTFIQAVVQDSSLPRHFSDDTLVAVLRSAGAALFLRRHQQVLLANDAQLLRRVIHLIRVACTTTPAWWDSSLRMPPFYFVPHGEAWAAVIGLVRTNLNVLLPQNTSLIVGLLHDWTGVVHPGDSLPAGSVDACAIAHAVLPSLTDYRSEQPLERMVRLLTLVPLADEAGFRRLLADVGNGTADRTVEDAVSHLLLSSMHGFAACRDVPDAVVTLAEQLFYLTDEDIRDPHFSTHWSELEPDFGLKDCGTGDFFPASALRGPFLYLLQCHPDLGIPFLIRFVNRAIDWYAERRVRRRDPLEQPWQTEITFADGTRVQQRCNGRLWQLYRGTSDGPYILQCALMALEHWLFHVCETRPAEVEPILLRLLRESDNAAVSGVVASIAMAYPELAGAAAVTLLTSSDFVRLDRVRMVAEAGAPSRMKLMFPQQADQKFYNHEREESDQRPHRLTDLEWAAIRLQQTPWRESVERVIDGHRSQLPAPEEQTDEDRIWRIALHRMDLRGYTAHVVPPAESPAVDTQTSTDNSKDAAQRSRVQMQSAPLEPDIQVMLDRDAPAETAEHNAMSLFMWGVGVFQRTAPTSAAAEWRERLTSARSTQPVESDATEPSGVQFLDRGIEFVAAVCVRDHWEELTNEERDWCFDTVCRCVAIGADVTDELHSVQRGGMDSSRSAAFVLPLLLTKSLTDDQRTLGTESLAIGLTHAVDEVKDYAVAGVGQYLWQADSELGRACVGAIGRAARTLDQLLEQQRGRPWEERQSSQELEHSIASNVRREIVERRTATDDDVRLDSGEWYACRFGLRTLRMLDGRAEEPLARAAYANAVQLIANVWAEDDRRSRRDYHWESDCELQIARFTLCIPTADAVALLGPILNALPDEAKEVASIVRDLVLAQEALKRPNSFWPLWQAIADRACQTTWPQRLDDRHAEHDDLLRKLFLNLEWNDGARHWDALDGNAIRLVGLFNTLPPTAAVLDAFVTYLYLIGSKSLPWAFLPIAQRLASGDARRMLALPNTVSGLELLLMRYVYAAPAFLKSNPELRQAILHILDELVESGSSRAYRMRDDFVTPPQTS